MLSRSYCEKGGHSNQNPNGLAPPLPLGMWNPFLAAALRANASALEGFGTLGSEWQGFLGRQQQHIFALIQRLSQSRTSDQVVSAYTDFWHQAAESYGKELGTLAKLASGVTSKMVVGARIVPEERQSPQASGAPSRDGGPSKYRRHRRSHLSSHLEGAP